MLGRLVNDVIFQGKEAFRIIDHEVLIFFKEITAGDSDTVHGWGYNPTLKLGAKNFPWFLHTIKVLPCPSLTDETKALGIKFTYDQSKTDVIYPKPYRYPVFESIFSHKAIDYDIDLTRFPIRIDSAREFSFSSTNGDSSNRTMTCFLMFWVTELIKELASVKK